MRLNQRINNFFQILILVFLLLLLGCVSNYSRKSVRQDYFEGFKELTSDVFCDDYVIKEVDLLKEVKSELMVFLEGNTEFKDTLEYIDYSRSPIIRSRSYSGNQHVQFFFSDPLPNLSDNILIHGGITIVMNPCEKKVEYISEFRWGN